MVNTNYNIMRKGVLGLVGALAVTACDTSSPFQKIVKVDCDAPGSNGTLLQRLEDGVKDAGCAVIYAHRRGLEIDRIRYNTPIGGDRIFLDGDLLNAKYVTVGPMADYLNRQCRSGVALEAFPRDNIITSTDVFLEQKVNNGVDESIYLTCLTGNGGSSGGSGRGGNSNDGGGRNT